MKTLPNSCLKKITGICLILLFVPLQGCRTLQIRHYQTSSGRPLDAVNFYERLDDTVKAEGVRNASGFPVPGFPYLRANRFLTALKDRLDTEEKRSFWIEQMRQFDTASRKNEIRNLPQSSINALAAEFGINADLQTLTGLLEQYSRVLSRHDGNDARFGELLETAVADPGEYLFWMRALGLYPLFTVPTLIGTNILYQEFTDWHKSDLSELDVLGSIINYSPPSSTGTSLSKVKDILTRAKKDAFGFPVLTQEQADTLLLYYAPVVAQDKAGAYDIPGTVAWKDGKVTVGTEQPAVYTFVSRAFIDSEPALQLNYAFWFEGRRGPNAPWLERGRLDGLTLRITIDEAGTPVMMDIMNNCGCYFMFIPSKSKIKSAAADTPGTKLLVPAWLPEDYPQKRLHVRVNSGWHQVQKVFTSDDSAPAETYDLLAYDKLEALPHENGRLESVFNRKGIMKDSFRIEPAIFFPAGIPRVGFMRQRGNHPIKLIGRAYFSDPDLYNNNFVYEE